MGLANRVVPAGQARQAAEDLAHSLAAFPQACLRADRRSAFHQFDLTLDDALAIEFDRGAEVLRAEGVAGAQRFARRRDKR
jgi:enoyl-CoA hydratase